MAKNDDLYDLLDGVKIDVKNADGDIFNLAIPTLSKRDQQKEEIKFTLYLKIRQLKQLSTSLQGILSKNESERDLWVTENQDFLDQLMMMVVSNSNLSLENIRGDSEISKLSLDLAMNLKKTITLINSLAYGSEDLAS